MLTELLAFVTMGPLEWIVTLAIGYLLIRAVMLIVRYFIRNKRDKLMLRMEVGKLAEEVEQIKQELKDEGSE